MCGRRGPGVRRPEAGRTRASTTPPVRYVRWLGDAVTGDLGCSARNGQPVWEALTAADARHHRAAHLLAVHGPRGRHPVRPARRPEAPAALFDRISTSVAVRGCSRSPTSCSPLMLDPHLRGERSGGSRPSGYTEFTENLSRTSDRSSSPRLTLALAEIAVYMRLLRTDLIATLQEDYITMAKAKGMSSRRILLRARASGPRPSR